MRTVLSGMAAMMLIVGTAAARNPAPLESHPAVDAYDGWRLAVQAWTFNRFTLFEAIEKAQAMGLSWIEAFPGQTVSADIQEKFDAGLSAEARQKVKAKLNESNVTLVNFGVVGLDNNEQQARRVFEFAKVMGVETIVSEPPVEAMAMLDKLCKEYQIGLAIHNHPKPSRYWNPETVAAACEGRSEWVGACADTGHWVRSGLEPVDCLKQLEGRIRSLHFKEIVDNTDVVWGTGENRAQRVLKELDRQGFKGTFSIEYETKWENNMPDIRQCIAWFNRQGAALKPTGWKPVHNETLGNMDFAAGSWALEDGVLTRKGDGDIWTKDRYGDFILDVEYKSVKDTNSGVFLRAQDHNWLPWIEVQVESGRATPPNRHSCGGLYDIIAPKVNALRPDGQWNRMTVQALGPYVTVLLNGHQVVDINLDDWKEAHKNPDGSANKFDVAYRDLPREGFLGFQDHGFPVWYRNLRIKPLNVK